jgi:hypothetical protein
MTMKKDKHTSPEMARLAGRVLADPKSPKRSRSLAASALAQASPPSLRRKSAR